MKILIEKKAIIKGKIKKEQKTESFGLRDEGEWISQSSTISPGTQLFSDKNPKAKEHWPSN